MHLWSPNVFLCNVYECLMYNHISHRSCTLILCNVKKEMINELKLTHEWNLSNTLLCLFILSSTFPLNIWQYTVGCIHWPSCSSILSHSSRMKCLMWRRLSVLLRVSARILPGVPTTMWGQSFFSTSSSFFIDSPPKKTATCRQNTHASHLLRDSQELCCGAAMRWSVIYLDSWHVLGESLILLTDLKGQFSRMAHHQNRHLKQNNDSWETVTKCPLFSFQRNMFCYMTTTDKPISYPTNEFWLYLFYAICEVI